MRMSQALSVLAAAATSRHCWSVRRPVNRFCEGTSAARERRRVTSCSRDIASEKIATFLCCVIATLSAMLSAILVLPMPGRAAMMTSSDLFRPRIRSSRSGRPVDNPGMRLPEAAASLIASKTFCMTWRISLRPPLPRFSRTACSLASAASSTSSAAPLPS